ncbi:GDP-mannose-dependent alpha-(1-6)-phosphatidylinositol monomannoside mannosyltransferase [Lacunisphaera limnophila]|uniref:GDP-mannose-dependent alpha-(1-6)-phosphatidylinositol monomannoside mannosyltransferase n=1 Tax=Lacunisphaera limnophila TaxID=1838286 RepID=A0A1D8AVP4_9BACT|nr:glycosyltransferase [Lacunisphaera limnophila]AOS44925.1 GDP-mannose-dependent alpha-(1-6)-phosphatidylinositol monomannoside mannosyltransferase [Lacunisphaera limnophila]
MSSPRSIVLLFTTFPKTSETFLQRDVAALQAKGLNLKLYSLWGGGGEFRGLPVRSFNKWRLVPLFLFEIPWQCVRRPRLIRDLFEGVCTRAAPSFLNFWENMLGAGYAGCFYRELQRDPPALIHGAWAGAPATAGWVLWRMFGWKYSCGAHAYDIYEHGGDWWLLEKLRHARFIHASTETGRRELVDRGVPVDRIRVIRRGLAEFPAFKPLRPDRTPLRLVCVARLVAKKGLDHQLRIYAALQAAGFAFEARIIGDGPLEASLRELAAQLGLGDCVTFLGRLEQPRVWEQLAWADVLLHTGVVAPSGDRDGLPNVIPEAMSAGVLVVTSPVSATTEAVAQERTGLVADVDLPLAWQVALQRLATDDGLAERLRGAARRWVEENYNAHRNTDRLVECFQEAMTE